MKTFITIMVIVTLANFILGQYQNFRRCGQDNPAKPTDCTIYGTDTGFLCCHVSNIPNGKDVCALMAYESAEVWNIKGTGSLPDGTRLDCGNSSSYLKVQLTSIASIFVIVTFIFMI